MPSLRNDYVIRMYMGVFLFGFFKAVILSLIFLCIMSFFSLKTHITVIWQWPTFKFCICFLFKYSSPTCHWSIWSMIRNLKYVPLQRICIDKNILKQSPPREWTFFIPLHLNCEKNVTPCTLKLCNISNKKGN